MKVASSLKTLRSRHPGCILVKRHGKVRIINKQNKRYQAKQG